MPIGGPDPAREPAAIKLAHDLIEALDAPALLELAGGNLADIESIFDSILDQARLLVAPPAPTGIITAPPADFSAAGFQELDRLSSSLHEAALVEDITYFIHCILPDFELNWHVIEWGHMVMWYRLLAIQAARDHGKSHFFSFAYILWKLWRFQRLTATGAPAPLGLRLSEKGLLVTNSSGLGKEFLDNIKTAIEERPALRERLYPNNRLNKWNTEQIHCRNGAKLAIESYPAARGPHPGYLVMDDLLDESSTYSSDARTKSKSHFIKVLMNMLVPHGQGILVGTPLHRDDLFSYVKPMKQWRFLQYPAIFPVEAGQPVRLLYEARHSYESLMAKKNDAGSLAFAQEQLCNPVSNDSTIFPTDILAKAYVGMEGYTLVTSIYAHTVKFKRVVMGCDFAISATTGADYSVFVTFGIDERDDLWLLNVYRERGKSYAHQQAAVRQLYADFKHDIIYMESNQMQAIYAQEAERHGLPVEASNTGVEKNGFIDGLPGVAILFEKGKMRFPRGDQYSIDMTDTICLEFGSIAFTDKGLKGVGGHDDCPMAVWKGVQASRHATFNFGFL